MAYCTQCGAAVTGHGRFCAACGSLIVFTLEAAPKPPEDWTPTPQQAGVGVAGGEPSGALINEQPGVRHGVAMPNGRITRLALFAGLIALAWIAYVMIAAVNFALQHPEACLSKLTPIGQAACFFVGGAPSPSPSPQCLVDLTCPAR
jgi:hypothetical protein